MEKSSRPCNAEDEHLAKFKLFAELEHDELKALVDLSQVECFDGDQKVISIGDPGHCMYVLLRGSVRVTAPNAGQEIELAVLKSGDFFGEVALVDDGPRSANVVTLEPCELLCITATTLGVLSGLQPGAAIHILAAIGRCLVARLRTGNQKYMDLIALGGQIS